MSRAYARVCALTAGIDALFARGDVTHAHVLAGELFELLEETARDGDAGPCEMPSERAFGNPTKTPLHVDRDLKPENVTKKRPATQAERQAKRRAKLRLEHAAAIAVASKQLELPVTGVTRRDGRDGPGVTNVTRDVTPSSDLFFSLSRPSGGLERERESSPAHDAVTAVTPVTFALPEQLPDELRAIFAYDLEQRPGVVLDADGLWRKFRRKDSEKPIEQRIASRPELRSKWGYWCKSEKPDAESSAPWTMIERPPSATPAAAARPGPRSAPVDPEELSRRVAFEQHERVKRELEERAVARARAAETESLRASSLEAAGLATRRAS